MAFGWHSVTIRSSDERTRARGCQPAVLGAHSCPTAPKTSGAISGRGRGTRQEQSNTVRAQRSSSLLWGFTLPQGRAAGPGGAHPRWALPHPPSRAAQPCTLPCTLPPILVPWLLWFKSSSPCHFKEVFFFFLWVYFIQSRFSNQRERTFFLPSFSRERQGV